MGDGGNKSADQVPFTNVTGKTGIAYSSIRQYDDALVDFSGVSIPLRRALRPELTGRCLDRAGQRRLARMLVFT